MDKVLTTALLTIAAVVAAVMVINALLPSVGKSSNALISSQEAATQRIKTDIEIIHVASDTSLNRVYVWVKNIGASEILAIDRSDIFLKTATSYDRLPYGAGAQYWDFIIEDDTSWRPSATSKITIYLSALPAGDYLVQFFTHNAVAAQKAFSV